MQLAFAQAGLQPPLPEQTSLEEQPELQLVTDWVPHVCVKQHWLVFEGPPMSI